MARKRKSSAKISVKASNGVIISTNLSINNGNRLKMKANAAAKNGMAAKAAKEAQLNK